MDIPTHAQDHDGRIISIFSIETLDHDRDPGVKSRYITGDATLMTCNLIDLSSVLSIEETWQQAFGLPSAPQPTTFANRAYCTPPHPPPPPPPKNANPHVLPNPQHKNLPWTTHHQGGSLGCVSHQ